MLKNQKIQRGLWHNFCHFLQSQSVWESFCFSLMNTAEQDGVPCQHHLADPCHGHHHLHNRPAHLAGREAAPPPWSRCWWWWGGPSWGMPWRWRRGAAPPPWSRWRWWGGGSSWGHVMEVQEMSSSTTKELVEVDKTVDKLKRNIMLLSRKQQQKWKEPKS